MRPALGVTEPAAIAFAVATAKTHVTGILQEAHVVLNSGMYKNAFTCGIPNSNEVGNAHAAALGYVAADANKGLECLDCVTKKHNIQAKKLLAEGKITVSMGEISSRIYIHVILTTNNGTATATIKDAHTNITEITENGHTVFSKEQVEKEETEDRTPIILIIQIMCKSGSSALYCLFKQRKIKVVGFADKGNFIQGNSLNIVQNLAKRVTVNDRSSIFRLFLLHLFF